MPSPSTLAVIPARYASSRLPGKPLALIDGRPMVEWVLRATQQSRVFDRVVVATDHQEIVDAVRAAGGEAVMTSAECQTGADRVADAARQLPAAEVVANVQGDQPFVQREMLEALVAPFRAGEAPEMTTVATPLASDEQFSDPNVVKVVCDRHGAAIYFSRSPIPHGGGADAGTSLHHIGLYAFRADFLQQFCRLPQTPLELSERLEQLRAIEHGYRIRVSRVAEPVVEVNTPEELATANRIAARYAGRSAA